MLLGFFTILIMLIIAYVYYLEGAFTALTMCCNVMLAGLVAFNFWEPIADQLGPILSGTFLLGFEDALCLIILFALTLGLLRLATNSMTPKRIELPPAVQMGGGALFGLLTGYFTAGFLLCMLQTLPWHENFMFFDPTYNSGAEHTIRRVLPPDRVWLSLMYRAGAVPFSSEEDLRPGPFPSTTKYVTFDKYGTFELRYARYRRYSKSGALKTYQGEFDEELQRRP